MRCKSTNIFPTVQTCGDGNVRKVSVRNLGITRAYAHARIPKKIVHFCLQPSAVWRSLGAGSLTPADYGVNCRADCHHSCLAQTHYHRKNVHSRKAHSNEPYGCGYGTAVCGQGFRERKGTCACPLALRASPSYRQQVVVPKLRLAEG